MALISVDNKIFETLQNQGIDYLELPRNGFLQSGKLEFIIPLINTAVNLRSQKQYDTYMQICEVGGWRVGDEIDGDLPTKASNIWSEYKRNTCVNAGVHPRGWRGALCYGRIKDFELNKIITLDDFCEMEDILPGMLGQIRDYFARKTKQF